MSAWLASTPDMARYVGRCAAVLRLDAAVRGMVTAIEEREPPIVQSPQSTIIPAVYVSPSANPIYRTEAMGRDSPDVAGARIYTLEVYSLVISRGATRQAGRASVEKIAAAVRDAYMRDQRLTAGTGEAACASLEVLEIPYVLRSDTPEISAVNVVCRPAVPATLRRSP